MENSQQGFIVPLLLAIIAVLVIGGGVYVHNNKKVEAPVLPEDTTSQTTTQNQLQTTTQTPSASNQPNNTAKVALTESDILNATYWIKPNLGAKSGLTMVARAVVFPHWTNRTNGNPFLTNIVWFKSNGTLAGVNVDPGAGEAFAIERYEWTSNQEDQSADHTMATVYIMGSYGATAHDDRVFLVKKANGKVTTQETGLH